MITGNWNWSNQVGVPGNKELRTDTGDWVNATVVNIDNTSDDGSDFSQAFTESKAGDLIRIESTAYWAEFQVQASPTVTSYISFAVVYIDGSGTLPDSKAVLSFVLTPQAAPIYHSPQISTTLILNDSMTIEQYNSVLSEVQDLVVRYRFLIQDVTTDNILPSDSPPARIAA
jgi:hypothetical protein